VTEPTAVSPAVARVDATREEIAATDAVVLLTDRDAFMPADIGRHAGYVLDCRRVLSDPKVETLYSRVRQVHGGRSVELP
jgi:UDP-N-acetyl-D-mannosaminuronate dehydrogenase